jgi:hypothetical protein
MEIASRESGSMIRLMDSERIFIETGRFIKDIGLITCRMDRAWRTGPMEASIKDSTKTVKNMEKGHTFGLMEATTQDLGTRTKSTDTENTSGATAGSTRENGG